MNLRVLCVGRRAHDPLIDAADIYLKRLARYTKVSLERVRDAGASNESLAIAQKIKPSEPLIILDARGELVSTQQCFDVLTRYQTQGTSSLAFAIGGADGHAKALWQKASAVWALSRMTLPHRMALVVLVEQLYRVHTMMRKEPYHRA